jgi:hypothetical protein
MLSDPLQRLRGLASRKANATKMTLATIIIEREGSAPLEIEMENLNNAGEKARVDRDKGLKGHNQGQDPQSERAEIAQRKAGSSL